MRFYICIIISSVITYYFMNKNIEIEKLNNLIKIDYDLLNY